MSIAELAGACTDGFALSPPWGILRFVFGFLLKKWFFDLWDTFLPSILVNLGFVLVVVVVGGLPGLVAPSGTAAYFAVLGILIAAAFVYLGGVVGVAGAASDFKSADWQAFVAGFRRLFKPSLGLGVLVVLHAVIAGIAAAFYLQFLRVDRGAAPVFETRNVLGIVALGVLFWMSVIWWLVAQYFLTVADRLNRRGRRALRSSLLLVADNIALSVGMALFAGVITVLSLVTAFLLPGIAGLALWYQDGIRLLLYKYDYLEANPTASRREVPWDELLYDDRERVGKRTLRGMIFPWRD